MFEWFKREDKKMQQLCVDILERLESLNGKEEKRDITGIFLIKMGETTISCTQLKSIVRDRNFITIAYGDTEHIIKTNNAKKAYAAIIKAIADTSARMVQCVINEAPTPYGMFSYRENPYPGPVGEDLIVDIDAIVKKVRD